MDNTYSLLIFCTCLCFVGEILNIVINPLLTLILGYRKKTAFSNDRNELVHIKQEMSKISMTDEFAKYILLNRKYDKLKEEMKAKVTEELKKDLKIRYTVTYSLYAIVHILYVATCWMNWNATVLKLPEHWLVPIGGVLSWPTSVSGSVSVPTWLMLSNMTAKLVSKSVLQRC